MTFIAHRNVLINLDHVAEITVLGFGEDMVLKFRVTDDFTAELKGQEAVMAIKVILQACPHLSAFFQKADLDAVFS